MNSPNHVVLDGAICPPGSHFATVVRAVQAAEMTEDEAVADLVSQLSDAELLGLLHGDASWRVVIRKLRQWAKREGEPFEAGRVDRLGIPGIRFTDGPRGVFIVPSTAFPVAISRGATWDPELEERVGSAIGAEARAAGANLFAGICVNLPPFPGWGRTQETYGEDPVLLGAMGSASVRGVSPWVMSCVKHFALNSMEEARFIVDVEVDEDVLHEVYLPHFRTVVEAGVDSVMSAYNSVNGTWVGDDPYLLTEVLRNEWGFEGFVQSDWVWGLRDPVGSVAAGQDLEMPAKQQRGAALSGALADGRLDRADVQRAAQRIVRAQLRLAVRARPTPARSVISSTAHRDLSREAAHRGAVLLRNVVHEGVPALPLVDSSRRQVALLGRLAAEANMGDLGSSIVRTDSHVSILDGLRQRLGDQLTHVGPDASLDAARDASKTASAAVVVVGLTADDEGESVVAIDPTALRLMGPLMRAPGVARLVAGAVKWGDRIKSIPGGDRRDLRLARQDVDLIRAVAAVNARTIVVVIGGGTVVLEPWDKDVAAILLAWYPGMEGGHAVADVLLGEEEAGGRLPLAIPKRQADLPSVDWRSRRVRYDRWWGQRKLDRDGVSAGYPFGFGLSYTDWEIENAQVGGISDESFEVTAQVTNTGGRTGRHVVQVYALTPGLTPVVRALLGFQSVQVPPGGTVTVNVACSVRPLQRWDGSRMVLEHGAIDIEVGAWSGDPDAIRKTVQVDPP